MSERDPAAPPRAAADTGARTLRTWGFAILAVGLVAAALIYVFAPDATGTDLADRIAHGRMYRHNVELMGGTLGVLIDDFDRWFSGLWRGKALAATVAAISLVAGFGCLAVARFAAGSDPREP